MEELEDKLEELQRLRQELEVEQDTLLCTQCMTRFDTKAEVKEHYSKEHKESLEGSLGGQKSRVVRRITRHLCHICAKHFADSWTLRHHQRTVHLESREHNCDHCPKSFLSHKDMTRHVKGVHLHQRIVFPGTTRKLQEEELCTVANIAMVAQGREGGETRLLPNILKKPESRNKKAKLVSYLSEVEMKAEVTEEDGEEGVEEILVKVEGEEMQPSTEPPMFQLENLENLQFVLQEGSGEPQIIIPESGIRLTIPGEEQEGQVLHLVPVAAPELGEQGNLFSAEEFNIPPDLSFSPDPPAPGPDFEPVEEKVVTEVKFEDGLADRPKKLIYKKVNSHSSPHLVAVKELAKTPRSIEQFKCSHCGKCFISGAFLEKHTQLVHTTASVADLGFIRTMINGTLETLELNTDYGDLASLNPIDSIGIEVEACPAPQTVTLLKSGSGDLMLNPEEASLQEPIREIICKICNKIFLNKLALSKHRKSAHKKQQKHRCDDCGSEFTSRQTLKAHVSSIHEGIKKVCSICLKPVADLVRHVRSQHKSVKKKDFPCDICQTLFRTNFALQRHKDKVHMKVKAWLCDLCEKTFGEKRDMIRHKNAVHFGIKNKHTKWTCPECNIIFKLRREYDEHKTSFHASLSEEQVVKFLNAELESKKHKFHISAYKM